MIDPRERREGTGKVIRPVRRARGVTILELLVVIVMIGILAAMGISRLDWTRYRADAIGRGVMAELTAAQRTAVSLQADVRVTILSSNRLQVHEDADNDGIVGTGERVTFHSLDHKFVLNQNGTPDLPAPANGTQITTGFVFRRDGSSSVSGALYVASPRADPAAKYARAIAVSRATGRVTWYSYGSGTWKRSS